VIIPFVYVLPVNVSRIDPTIFSGLLYKAVYLLLQIIL